MISTSIENKGLKSITFNDRVASMQPSATLAMTAAAKTLKAAGHAIIGLSAGEPDFDTPELVSEAGIGAIRSGQTRYTHNLGMPELRAEISRKLLRDNELAYDSEHIICSNGAKQSVALVVSVLCRDGDEVLIPAPYWVSYPEMVRFAGGVPIAIPTTVDSNYLLSPEQLEAAITKKTKILILCSPSNPTGSVYSQAQMEGLAAVLRKHPHIFVISDEIYEHIIYDAKHISMASIDGMKEQTITVNGFSKAFAMTGWRLGYFAARPDIVKAASKLQSQMTSAPSTIAQVAGIAALRLDHAVIQKMVDQFRKRRDMVVESMRSIPGVKCPTPDGAFYVFPDIGAYLGGRTKSGREIKSSTDLCMYLLEEHDVALVPGDAFGGERGMRISYAASDSDLIEACKRIHSAFSDIVRVTS
jgi:aspartate aminotransferase